MPHPGHEIGQARAGAGGQGVAGVPQVVEVEAGQPDIGDGLSPTAAVLEVGSAQCGVLGPGEDQRIGDNVTVIVIVIQDPGHHSEQARNQRN